jgi:hypothetical protein
MKWIAAAMAMLFLCGCAAGSADSNMPPRQPAHVNVGATPAPTEPLDANAGVTFLGFSTQAAEIVYVIDRSGSMLSSFDDLRTEILSSVKGLDPQRQRFHILLFAGGEPLELPGAGAAHATANRKKAAEAFLADAFAAGETDPFPAMWRAFDVLAACGHCQKTIFLVSDSGFANGEEVIKICRNRNVFNDVHVHTFLYASHPNGAEDAMRRIAEENGGQYQFVRAEE